MERDNGVLRICFVRCFESIDQPLQLFVGQSHPTLHAFGTYYRPNCFICRRIIDSKSYPKAPSFGRDFDLWSALCAGNLSAIILHLWRVCHRSIAHYHCIIAVYHHHYLFISLLSLSNTFRFRHLFRGKANASIGHFLSWSGHNGQW